MVSTVMLYINNSNQNHSMCNHDEVLLVQLGSVACEYKEDRSLHEVEDPVEDYCSVHSSAIILMVFILDGNSEIGALVKSNLCN